jgi:hypothetical protein
MHQQFVNAVNTLGVDSEFRSLFQQGLLQLAASAMHMMPQLVTGLPCQQTLLVMFRAEAVPKRILDLMNVEGLTRENVASHLQVATVSLQLM